jgi:hypothetical protein
MSGKVAKIPRRAAKLSLPSKQKFAFTCVRLSVRAADGVWPRLDQDKWK